MCAKVLNPISSEMGRAYVVPARAPPNKAALARVRRDLFGPVDHAAARKFVEQELRNQAAQDQERWGFDFNAGLPKNNARYEWEIIGPDDVVPEAYKLRGMPYIREHACGTPKKRSAPVTTEERSPHLGGHFIGSEYDVSPKLAKISQRTRVPENGEDVILSVPEAFFEPMILREPTTPVPVVKPKKQSSITDFMKGGKRKQTITSKLTLEPAQKMTRKAGRIRS